MKYLLLLASSFYNWGCLLQVYQHERNQLQNLSCTGKRLPATYRLHWNNVVSCASKYRVCHDHKQNRTGERIRPWQTPVTTQTSLPKLVWEKGRVAALSHTYTVKSPLVTMVRPKFTPKSTPSRGQIAKPHHLPHPWTRPTYDAKRHPDPIHRFPQCTGQTDRQTDRSTDRSFTVKFDDYRPLRSESDDGACGRPRHWCTRWGQRSPTGRGRFRGFCSPFSQWEMPLDRRRWNVSDSYAKTWQHFRSANVLLESSIRRLLVMYSVSTSTSGFMRNSQKRNAYSAKTRMLAPNLLPVLRY